MTRVAILCFEGTYLYCAAGFADMLEVAKSRVARFLDNHAMPALVANLRWHPTTIEETDLPDGMV